MGKLIAIDGLDGSGKETQTKRLYESLTARGIRTRMLSFPMYGTPGCDLVERYLHGEFGDDPAATNAYAASSFFAMDRYYSYRTDWGDFYAQPDTVILANRYTSANAVHQLSKLPRAQWDVFLTWLWTYEFSQLQLPKPDQVIYLELAPAVSLALVAKRSAETGRVQDIHERNPAYMEQSYQAALYAARKLGFTTISCAPQGKLRTIQEIHEEILQKLKL